jgi:hypothetical protein
LEVKGKHAVLFEHENTNTEYDIVCVYLCLSHTSYTLNAHLKYIHKKQRIKDVMDDLMGKDERYRKGDKRRCKSDVRETRC